VEHYWHKPLVPELVRAKVLEFLPPPPPAIDLQPATAQDRL
jgi:hypothetical protein